MTETAPLRLGIVGTGNIGRQHIKNVASGAVDRVSISAVCSPSTPIDLEYPHFQTLESLLTADAADAVLIAAPTSTHAAMGVAVLRKGRHVLMEKPLGRSLREATGFTNAVAPGLVAAVMLNQRLDPHFVAIKRLIDNGVLGELQRVSWTMTHWYRPDIYFRVSSWRGTWVGEGGGLLLNQCIHNLDILQWLIGMPNTVSASCAFGKYHDIEVEDEVTAVLNFGEATGVIVASTGESPGVNQLDLVGDRATIRYDGDQVLVFENDPHVSQHRESTSEMFGMPTVTRRVVDATEAVNQHAVLLQNFVDAIHDGVDLITPATAGLPSLELANAMLMSAWTGTTVSFPLDEVAYEELLAERIAQSSLRTPETLDVQIDMNKSYR